MLVSSFPFSCEPNENDINEGVWTRSGRGFTVPLCRLKLIPHLLPLLDPDLDEFLDFGVSKRAPCVAARFSPALQSFEVDLFCLEARLPKVLLNFIVQGRGRVLRECAKAGVALRDLDSFKGSAPLVIPVNKEGNESMISAKFEPPQVTWIRTPSDRNQFGVPGYVRSLILESIRARDEVKTQRVCLYKHPTFKDLLMGLDDGLHLVRPRCEEERLQIVKGVDGGDWQNGMIDSSEDHFPCSRRVLYIDAW